MATYSQSLGTFYGYANGNPYGRYNCYLDWDGTTRSGSTVTLVNPVLRMTRTDAEKYTVNRIATRIYVAGSEITSSSGYTLNAYNSQAPNPITYAFNNRSITTNSTSFTVRIIIASTGGNSGWTNFQSTNLDTTVTISCPSAYPTYTTAPSITNIQETSLVINRGATDITSKFYYQRSGTNTWTELTAASTTITGLSPGTSYTFKFKADNATDASLSTPAADIAKTTYKYPYITGISTADINIGGTQKVTLYNPLSRSVTVYMAHNKVGGTTIYSEPTSSTSLTFTVPVTAACAAIGASNKSGTAYYYCQYGSNTVSTSLTGTYKTLDSFKPTWDRQMIEFFTYKDGNDSFVESITKNNQLLVQQKSKLFYGVDYANFGATSAYSSTIARYEISINNGAFTTIPSSSTTATIDSGFTIPSDLRSVVIAVRAIDARGYVSNTLSKILSIEEYAAPQGTVDVYRIGGYGTDVALTISPIWGINGNNKGTAKYSYKKDGGSYSSEVTTTTFNTPITFSNMSNESSFTFKVVLYDSFGRASSEFYCNLGIGEPILFIDTEQVGVGVNCFPEGKGLHVKGNSIFHDTLSAEGNINANASVIVKEAVEVGAHRIMKMTRNGQVRTGFFYTGGNQ